MSKRAVVSFYTAPARSGKTYRLVVRICDELLPNGDGMIYTNLPLYVDEIAKYCAKKYGINEDDVKARLHIIPREIEATWRDAGRPIYDMQTGRKTGMHPLDGPWTYFAEHPLAGSTIIIDEIHNFCGSIGTPKPVSNEWQKWLGELGHNQAVFICISQAPEKVHACIKQEAQASYTIRNTGLDRDPYFKIELYDWLELWSGLFGNEYRIFVFEQEIQKKEGRRARGQRQLTLMGPPYFDFYDSFAKPISNEQTSNVATFEHEYEKHLRKGPLRGRMSLIRWFVIKNLQPLFSRLLIGVAVVAAMVYLLSGGAGDMMKKISGTISAAANKKTTQSDPPPNDAPADPPPRITRPRQRDTRADAQMSPEFVQKMQKAYDDELKRLQLENRRMGEELQAVQDELSRQSAVILITPESIVLQGGHVYGVGDEFVSGDWKGRKVSRIEYGRREAVLDDDSVLGLAD